MARKCIVCGKEYSYCKSCPKDAKKETWYALYDNENCKNISQALTDYNFNKITKEDAKDILSKCDLSINLMDYYRNTLDVVMAKPKRTQKVKPVNVEEVIIEQEPAVIVVEQEEAVVEIKEEAVEEPVGVVITE